MAKRPPKERRQARTTGRRPVVKRGAAPRATVLVVEDFADAREMYVEFLLMSGYRALEAHDGVEALQMALEHRPDLILMDLSMPGMDGWEATKRLKSDDRTRRIPVVALTGHALEGHSERARAAGCDSFLIKPCLPDTMLAEVERMLGLKAPTR